MESQNKNQLKKIPKTNQTKTLGMTTTVNA